MSEPGAARRMIVDNSEELRIVEIIGQQRARLSPEGKDLWERAERLVETSQPSDDPEALEASRADLLRQAQDLPEADRVIWQVLVGLFFRLRASSLAEDRWGVEVADKFRRGTIIKAAQERAEAEGRTVTPAEDMSMDEALALLAEPYSPDFR